MYKKLYISLKYHKFQTGTLGPNRWEAALILLGLREATVFQSFPKDGWEISTGMLPYRSPRSWVGWMEAVCPEPWEQLEPLHPSSLHTCSLLHLLQHMCLTNISGVPEGGKAGETGWLPYSVTGLVNEYQSSSPFAQMAKGIKTRYHMKQKNLQIGYKIGKQGEKIH